MLSIVVIAALLCLPGVVAAWEHDFATAGSAFWADFGYSLLDDTEAEFVANTYAVVSLEKCTGRDSGFMTEEAIYRTAAQLKGFNPDLKVLFYWSTSQAGIACYKANEALTKHPEWLLRDGEGKLVSPPRIDVTNADAVNWWLSVPLNGTDGQGNYEGVGPVTKLIDGILADDSGYNAFPGFTTSRLEQLYSAKLSMIQRMQKKFSSANAGVVLGNGLSEYDQSPQDPHNLRIIEAVDAVQNEHYAAFEQVETKTGQLVLPKLVDALNNMETLAKRKDTKHVFASFWAGPYQSPSAANGWPSYTPGGGPFNDTAPSGNTSSKLFLSQWAAALEKWFIFNLCSFLSVAGPRSFMTMAVWYEVHQGFISGLGCGPSPWYPALKRPLGQPLRDRQSLKTPYSWKREFEHATVFLDLEDPLGNGTRIVWA